jgi:uncharacterized membrane protein
LNWYYEQNGEQAGPVSAEDIQQRFSRGELTRDSLVWKEGLANWIPLGESELNQQVAADHLAAELPTQAVQVPAAPGMMVCAESGEHFDEAEMVQVGDAWVGLPYRDQYLQKLKEGGGASAGLGAGGTGTTLNPAIMQKAKEALQGNWGTAIGVLILQGIISQAPSAIPFLGIILMYVIMAPLQVGVAIFFLNVARNRSPLISNMFDGFKQFGQSLGVFFLMMLLIFAWSLLLIIPGIIKAYAYMMAYYIIADHPTMGCYDALKKSEEMMRGSKMKFFGLAMRYFWLVMTLIIVGIGLIFVGVANESLIAVSAIGGLIAVVGYGMMFFYTMPLFSVAAAHFYDDVRGKAGL